MSHRTALTTTRIVFQIEPADRSVGIMSEGFSAWEEDGTCWCVLDDISPPKFSWFDDQGECKPPPMHLMVEGALIGFANEYYVETAEKYLRAMGEVE